MSRQHITQITQVLFDISRIIADPSKTDWKIAWSSVHFQKGEFCNDAGNLNLYDIFSQTAKLILQLDPNMERQLSSVCNRFQTKFQCMLFFTREISINVESTHWRSLQPLENGRGGSISGKGTRETLASSCGRMDAKFSRFDSTALQRWLNHRSQTPWSGHSGVWKLGKWGVQQLKHRELLNFAQSTTLKNTYTQLQETIENAPTVSCDKNKIPQLIT
jgi:hypothetical protein